MPPAPNRYSRIWSVVRRIPRGRVATYGQIATLAGLDRSARLAGYALHALPEGSPLPWHRVVGAGGRLSLARLDPDGALTQQMRLEREGVRFDARGRVDLERFRWRAGSPTRARRRVPRAGGTRVRQRVQRAGGTPRVLRRVRPAAPRSRS